MAKDRLEEYEVFYAEIPSADYLNDIDNNIQDEYVGTRYEDIQGLSDQQVSELARDSMQEADNQEQSSTSINQNLFSTDS